MNPESQTVAVFPSGLDFAKLVPMTESSQSFGFGAWGFASCLKYFIGDTTVSKIE